MLLESAILSFTSLEIETFTRTEPFLCYQMYKTTTTTPTKNPFKRWGHPNNQQQHNFVVLFFILSNNILTFFPISISILFFSLTHNVHLVVQLTKDISVVFLSQSLSFHLALCLSFGLFVVSFDMAIVHVQWNKWKCSSLGFARMFNAHLMNQSSFLYKCVCVLWSALAVTQPNCSPNWFWLQLNRIDASGCLPNSKTN